LKDRRRIQKIHRRSVKGKGQRGGKEKSRRTIKEKG
jgi:hypothetical protein